MNARPLTWICLALALAPSPGAGAGQTRAISGTLSVAPDLAHHLGPDDRLILKIYHPRDGLELDAKYQIVPRFDLPLEFYAAPSIDMSGQTRFDAYALEAFTDKDADVLAVAPGELIARTSAPVPLGTTGLRLELNALRD